MPRQMRAAAPSHAKPHAKRSRTQTRSGRTRAGAGGRAAGLGWNGRDSPRPYTVTTDVVLSVSRTVG